MRFLVDACLDVRLAAHLATLGHDAIHLRDIDAQSFPDPQVFAIAVEQVRTVITSDLDFGEIIAARGARGAGVLLFRLRDVRLHRLVERLSSVLLAAEDSLMRGAIVIVEESRYRVREFEP